jgi:PII-like signaling protein
MSHYERACRLSIYLGNADIEHRRPLSAEILFRAHRAGLRGATTLHGIEGYGHSGKVHDIPTWKLVDRTPITVHIIDSPARIRAFLPQLDEFAGKCLIVCDDVRVQVPGTAPPD